MAVKNNPGPEGVPWYNIHQKRRWNSPPDFSRELDTGLDD